MTPEQRERALRLIWNTPDPRGEDGTVIADNWIDALAPLNAILDALAPIFAEVEAAAVAGLVAALRADAELCDCAARSEGECACGAWDGFKRVYVTDIADQIERGEIAAIREQNKEKP